MSPDSNITRSLSVWVCLLALVAALAATAGLAAYAHFGGALLAQGDSGVSRLFLGEALRMERAGEPEQARVLYDKAFRAGFSYPPDRSSALVHYGKLLWRQGQVREATETLSAAVSGSAPNFGGAPTLVEALLHLRRLDEAQSLVRRWRESLSENAAPEIRAKMLYCAGRVAQERGDMKEARAAYEESAALVPGTSADYCIALLCRDAGNLEDARQYLLRFMLGGATGEDAAKARELCRTTGAEAIMPK